MKKFLSILLVAIMLLSLIPLSAFAVFAEETDLKNAIAIGDIDSDGDIDASDYVLVKRAVLKTYTLSEAQKSVADVDADSDVDATDYVLVKRIVLGTYCVEHDFEPATCITPQKCKTCGLKVSDAFGHSYEKTAETDDDKISVITYTCKTCGNSYNETINKITAELSHMTGLGMTGMAGFRPYALYTINASGGDGDYQYKYEVFESIYSSYPALSEDFSYDNTFYFEASSLANVIFRVTIKDKSGNTATYTVYAESNLPANMQ